MLGRHVGPRRRAPVKRALLAWLRCPECQAVLVVQESRANLDDIDTGTLVCAQGHQFPVVRGVPRFVEQDAYTESFSYEWQRFRHTQLDSFTGRHDTRDRLQASLNFPLEELRGKRVLDAGCGMGRFAEIVHQFGGEYVGIDYSFAVDAAQENVGRLAG